MKTLKNVKKCVMEIAQILGQNDKVVKLLYNDETTALIDPKPVVDLNTLIQEHYICICAPVESGIKDSWKNTFLTILLDEGLFSRADDNGDFSVKLYVTTDEQHLILEDNQNRLFELLDEIINTLDGFKLSSAGKLRVNNFKHTMLSEFRFAYVIGLDFAEQNTKVVEI